MFQFVLMNVSDVTLTVMPLPAPVIVTVTSPPVGRDANRTVYVALLFSGTVRVDVLSVTAYRRHRHRARGQVAIERMRRGKAAHTRAAAPAPRAETARTSKA